MSLEQTVYNTITGAGEALPDAISGAGSMLYDTITTTDWGEVGSDLVSSSVKFYGDTLPSALSNAGPAIKSFAKDNWPDLAGAGIGLGLSMTRLNPVMDVVDMVTMALDLVDPKGYNSQVDRGTFTDFSGQLIDSIGGLRTSTLDDMAKAKYGVELSKLGPVAKKKIEDKMDESMGASFGRFYRIDERGPFDMYFQLPNGATGTLNQCTYLSTDNLGQPSGGEGIGQSLNFMLNTAMCPPEYIQAYKDYYIGHHPDTQIKDCKVSDKYLDLKAMLDDTRCRDLVPLLNIRVGSDGTASTPISTSTNSSLIQEWNSLNCKAIDYSIDTSDLQYSNDPARTFGSCTVDPIDGKSYKKRSKVIIQLPKNGGKECQDVEEKVLCPDTDCVLSDWYHLDEKEESKPGWSNCIQSDTCMSLANKQTSLTTDEQQLWSTLKCDTKAMGQYYQYRVRDITTEPMNNGKACESTYEEKTCPPQDCVLKNNWSNITDGCSEGSLLCSIWDFEEKNNASIYCNTENCLREAEAEKTRRDSYCKDASSKYYQYQQSDIQTQPEAGGKECQTIRETECGANDCQVSEWTEWSDCYEFLDESTNLPYYAKLRTREITKEAENGGSCNISTYEEEKCEVQNCELTDWSDWSECYPEDGVLTKFRSRSVKTDPMNGGTACPTDLDQYFQSKLCTLQASADSGSSTTIESFRFQTTDTTNPNLTSTGEFAPEGTEKVFANVNCEVSPWTEWSGCAPTEDGSYQRARIRSIVTYPKYEGMGCGPLEEKQTCIAQDCVVGNWTSTDCYLDTETNSYKKLFKGEVITPPANGGAMCPSLVRTEDCPAVPCETTEWTDWSKCYEDSGQAGIFKQLRSRQITQYPRYGGEQCGDLTEEKSCPPIEAVKTEIGTTDCYLNDEGNPVRTRLYRIDVPAQYGAENPDPTTLEETISCEKIDCAVSDWTGSAGVSGSTGWSDCYRTGEGNFIRTRTRSITQIPENGGSICPSLVENESCEAQNCEVSEWTDWSLCVLNENGYPVQYRSRSIINPEQNGGSDCPSLLQSKECETTKDCVLTDWTDWSECVPVSETDFIQYRSRAIVQFPEDGGKLCDPLIDTKKCPPQDCALSVWSDWSICAADENGQFKQTRKREILTPGLYGGATCGEPALLDTRDCATTCKYGEWGEWTPCLPLEGNIYIQSRSRELLEGGNECYLGQQETRSCTGQDCIVSDWSEWSGCGLNTDTSNEAPKYIMTRTRTVVTPAANGGKACEALEQVDSCTVPSKDCILNEWSEWSDCSLRDDNTYKATHSRTIYQYPEGEGQECGPMTEDKICEPEDCQYTEWSEWTACHLTGDDTFSKLRTREIQSPEKYGGKACTEDLVQEEKCENEVCEYSQWTDWSECIPVDGIYKQLRTRILNRGGSSCSDVLQYQDCAPQDCEVGEWSDWSQCYLENEAYIQSRFRDVTQQPSNGGKACEPLQENKACSPQDCQYSNWSDWSQCYLENTQYIQSRFRDVIQDPTNGGKICDSVQEDKPCPAQDCKMSDWTDWSQCYLDNTQYIQSRFRNVVDDPSNGGKICGSLQEDKPCPAQDCKLSDWTDWSQCYVDNDLYIRSRYRTVLQDPSNGGKACDPLTQSETCAVQDCVQSEWSDWSECLPVENGQWVQIRTRDTITLPTLDPNGNPIGKACSNDIEQQVCPAEDCEVSEWTDSGSTGQDGWSTCFNDENGVSSKVRFRDIIKEPRYGGMECPDLYEWSSC